MAEVQRLGQELAEACRQKEQAAEYGLAVLEEKLALQQRHEDLENEHESLRNELDRLKEAFGAANSKQRRVAEAGESREESLLQESACKEAKLMTRIDELHAELVQTRAALANSTNEGERLVAVMLELRECMDLLEIQKNQFRNEVKELKLRESRLQQDNTELEDENVSLQKQVSTLRQNQVCFVIVSGICILHFGIYWALSNHHMSSSCCLKVEFEGLKYELRRFEEEVEFANSQLEESLRLKSIAERHLEEALDSLKAEREQKNSLRKELSQYLHLSDSLYTSQLSVSLEGLKFSDDALAAIEMSSDSGHGSGLVLNGHEPEIPGQGLDIRHSSTPRGAIGHLHPVPSLVSDLLSELHLSEVQKLRQQLLQVERDKANLLASLDESQQQLLDARATLAEQRERISCLRRPPTKERQTELELEKERDTGNEDDAGDYELDPLGPEILECRYRAAVQEAREFRVELKAERDATLELRGRWDEERAKLEEQVQGREDEITRLDRVQRASAERAAVLQRESNLLTVAVKDARGELCGVREELGIFSEELAQLYHHVCLCNGETPQRVLLDHYRQGVKISVEPVVSFVKALESDASEIETRPSSKDENETSPQALALPSVVAVLKEQVQVLRQAVGRTAELARQHPLPPDPDVGNGEREREALLEETLKLKSLLSTKREQIATLRTVIKANKQTAEVALSNLKSKYENEKSMVRETMLKLRNELKALKEDAATFSSLRAMFATRCDEYVSQLDDMQRQLAAAEDEKRTLNSLLRMAIQQKLALTQRLEDLEFDHEQTRRTRPKPAAGTQAPSVLIRPSLPAGKCCPAKELR
uniref:Bicaudal D n=1 Tax=Eptatretus burgeri TaxID=7764 RepID=A0A8C4R927_EPTBU